VARQRELLLTAKTAEKFDLYQRSLQAAESVRFLENRFRILTGRSPRVLREDFCGSAFNSCEFIKLHPKNRAIGIDLDDSALRWCLQNNYPNLKESQWERITLIKANVLIVETPKADLIAALNYSYAIFKKRSDLRRYLVKARKSLVKGGAIMLDAASGTDLSEGFTFEGKCDEFNCISEWRAVDPISHDYVINISYLFKDGSWIRNAFIYEYRLWTLPELQDLLLEAGFRDIHVIWGYRQNNWEDLVFKRTRHARFNGAGASYALVVGRA